MSTAILENETATVGKVSRSAIRAYRESVARGECDETILFNGRKLKIEWDKDRTVYLSRVGAHESLTTEVPRLEEAAAEVGAALTQAESFAGSPLPDSMTIGDLRQRIHAANDKLPVATPAEIANGLAFLVDPSPSGRVGRLKSLAIRNHGAVSDCRSRAEQVLFQSAADQRPDSTAQSLQQRIAQVKDRIAARQPVLRAEELIREQKATCEAISRGDISPPITPGALTTDAKANWVRNAYRQARERLDELMGLLAGRQDAIRDNERDQAELAKLQAKVQAAHEAYRARVSKPEAMRWVGDE